MDPIYKQLQNRMLKNMFMGLKTMKSMQGCRERNTKTNATYQSIWSDLNIWCWFVTGVCPQQPDKIIKEIEML